MFIYGSSNIRHLTHTLGFCLCIYLLYIFICFSFAPNLIPYACDIFIGRNLTGEYEVGTVQIKSVAQESTELWKGKTHQVGVKDVGDQIIDRQEFHVKWWSLWGLFSLIGFYSLCTCSLEYQHGEALLSSEADSNINQRPPQHDFGHFAFSDL